MNFFKLLLNLIVLSFVPISLFAQEDALYMFVQEGNQYDFNLKFGFKNSKGEILVPYIYDYIPKSRDMGDRLEFVSNPRFIFLGEFNEGMAVVYKKDKGYGFVNAKGKEIIPCQYKSALAFTEGLAAVKNENDKWGYINMEGEVVIPFIYDFPQQFFEGVALVQVIQKDKDLYYYIDKQGNKLNKTASEYIGFGQSFSNDRGPVKINNKCGYINNKGELVIPLIYDWADPFFKNNMALVSKDEKTMWIDKNGKKIFDNLHTHGWFYENDGNFYGITWINDEKGLIQDNGKVIIPCKYKDIHFDKDSKTVVALTKDDKVGIFDLQGNLIIPFEYDQFGGYGDGLYKLKKKGYYGFINKDNKICIPFEYEDADAFKYKVGLTYVKKGGFWNLINTKGEEQTIWCEESEIEKKAEEVLKKSINTEIDIDIPISQPNNTNTFAIIWGNESYMESCVEDAIYAIHDSEIVNKYFSDVLGIPEKNIRYRENATQSQMQSDIVWLKKIAENYDGEASLLIYYSGHGIPDRYKGDSYLIPSDGNPNDFLTLLNLNTIYDDFNSLNIKKCAFFLDACFSGKTKEGNNLVTNRGITIKNVPLNHNNLFILSASQPDEAAYPFIGKGHGMFSYYFLNILNQSNGKATLSEIANFVIENTKKTSLLENHISQSPSVFCGSNVNPNIKLK